MPDKTSAYREKWTKYGERIRRLREEHLDSTRQKFAERVNDAIPSFGEINAGHIRGWERGSRPPREIQQILDNWMGDYNVPEIPGPSSSAPFRIYGENIPSPGSLKETEKKYSGAYICFYDERHISEEKMTSGEKIIFARRYILDNIDQIDASLYGRFLDTFDLNEEKPPSKNAGTVKFFFSPISNLSNLAYVIELDELQDHPPRSGIVRAGVVGDDTYFLVFCQDLVLLS